MIQCNKRCPFCGSCATLKCRDEYIENEFYTIPTSHYRVVCDNVKCGARTQEFDRCDVALAAWNKRVRRKAK